MIVPNLITAFRAALRAGFYFIRTGKLRVSDADRKARLGVCLVCPHYKPVSRHSLMGQCSVCTCVVQAKTQLVTEKCPKNLWIR